MSDQSSRGNRIIIIVLLVALIAAVAGLYFQKQEKDAVVADLTGEKEALIVDLDELAAQYEALILENENVNSELVVERARIIALRDSVVDLQSDVARLTRYRNEVYKLKKEKAALLAKADSLIVMNEQLAMEKSQVEEALSEEKELTNVLNQKKTELETKISRGQVLNAVEIIAGGIKKTGSGEEKEVTKARKVDRIKTCFVLARNEIAGSGEKVIYLRVTDSEGMLIGKGIEEYAVNYRDQKIVCSEKQTVIYNNEAMDVCMYIDRAEGQKWIEGTYQVEVYTENELIGKSSFTLESGLF